MKRLVTPIIAFLFFAACNRPAQKQSETENTNARFDRYKENFIEALWKLYPAWASSVGYHKYDSVLTVPDEHHRALQIEFANAHLDSLKSFDLGALSDQNKTDYYMMQEFLNGNLWSIRDEKSYEWNPSSYNVSGVFAEMLNNNYDSLDNRLRNFNLRLSQVPAYYEAAKTNIKNPTVEHTQLAIDQNMGGLSVFEKDLPDALNKSTWNDQEKNEITQRAHEAVRAIKDFATWLKNYKSDTPRNFRLGEELYRKKFEYEIQSGYSAGQIFEKAVAHKKELHEKMAEISSQLWNKYFPGTAVPTDTLKMIRQMIDRLSLLHTTPDSFQTAIEKQIPELVNFVKEKNLLYMDPSKPLVVRREPDYMAGVAGASISAPGPYDKNGNTYYNVGSLSGWSKEKAESYLREYNYYLLQVLNIHEAIPGHYAQLIYSNQSPSIIKSILGNGTMVEGWAVYSERMMLEEGYGNNEPEMWLMYYKWNLRSTCNTILDYSVHTKNMSKDEAMSLLMNEAFQQKAEAEGKWKRVSVTQVQLCCYFTGYSEIYEFREELKKLMGNKFSLKEFHEKFLSYGSAPVKYIRQLMLTELKIKS